MSFLARNKSQPGEPPGGFAWLCRGEARRYVQTGLAGVLICVLFGSPSQDHGPSHKVRHIRLYNGYLRTPKANDLFECQHDSDVKDLAPRVPLSPEPRRPFKEFGSPGFSMWNPYCFQRVRQIFPAWIARECFFGIQDFRSNIHSGPQSLGVRHRMI